MGFSFGGGSADFIFMGAGIFLMVGLLESLQQIHPSKHRHVCSFQCEDLPSRLPCTDIISLVLKASLVSKRVHSVVNTV